MNIYVASSWRNALQPSVVEKLREWGHDVYDFRHPIHGNDGFSWREISDNWQNWTPNQYREALKHPIAKRGYLADKNALDECKACVMVLPSGRSASWELGYAMGAGKEGYVLVLEKNEPELMYLDAQILVSMEEFKGVFGGDVEKQ